MKDSDSRTVHTFEFSMKIENETNFAEVTIRGGDLAVDTFYQRGPDNWDNVAAQPLHPSLIKAVELLLAEALKTAGVTS